MWYDVPLHVDNHWIWIGTWLRYSWPRLVFIPLAAVIEPLTIVNMAVIVVIIAAILLNELHENRTRAPLAIGITDNALLLDTSVFSRGSTIRSVQ